MSIWDMIDVWERDGTLVILQPEIEASGPGRFVIATSLVHEELYGAWVDGELQARYARARQLVDAFITNQRIPARYPPSKSVNAQLALLESASEEVWEFRSSKPGIRVFGRFAEFNVFVATNTELREKIGVGFEQEKEECKRIWRLLFPTYRPLAGRSLRDYFSNFYGVGDTRRR